MNIAATPQVPLLDLDLLKTLVAIAETGNFSAAAEVVFRSPSAVSMQIKKMEGLLGRPVFIRDSRSVTLTTDGEALLLHARRVLALNTQIVSQFIRPDVAGTVRLGATDHASEAFLTEALRRFAQTHPSVSVDVTVDHSSQLRTHVERGAMDIALVTCQTGDTRPAEILRRETLVWAGMKGGIAVEKTPLPISVWEDGCIWRKAAVTALESQSRAYRVTFKSSYISAQKAGVRADLAIAPLPSSALGGDVVEICQSYGLPALPDYTIGMILTKDASAPIKAVADHLRATVAQR